MTPSTIGGSRGGLGALDGARIIERVFTPFDNESKSKKYMINT